MYKKSIVLLAGLMASSVALADPFMDPPSSGVRASYSFAFGGSGSAPVRQSLALSAGLTGANLAPGKIAELRWDDRSSELLVAGQPFASKGLNAANTQERNWRLSDSQALYLLVAGGALVTAVAVSDYIDRSGGNSNPGGTGGTGGSN